MPRNSKIAITTGGVVLSTLSWYAGCIDCFVLTVTGVFIFDVFFKQAKKVKKR